MTRLFALPAPVPARVPDEPEPWDGYEGVAYEPDDMPDFVPRDTPPTPFDRGGELA